MKLVDRWRTLDPAWKFALGGFIVARVWLTIWSLLTALVVPMVLQNLDLFGAPVLAVFDLQSSERYAYSREIDDTVLIFRAAERGMVMDTQTASLWSLRDGRAAQGVYAGRVLKPSAYPVEDIFPYHGVAADTNPLLAYWQRFDTIWYLAIAARGYAVNASAVYFPVYPALIRVVSVFTGNAMLAALLISNAALIGVLVLLYRLTAHLFDDASARRAVAYLLFFPTSFFLFAGYTESLFLFFTLAALVRAFRRQWFLAALIAMLAALTRLQGVLLILPLVYLWWQARGNGHATRNTQYALLLIPLATILFLALTNLGLMSAYQERLHAQFVFPWDNLGAAIALIASGHGSLIDLLNLLVTVLLMIMVARVWTRLPRAYGWYAVAMLLAPLWRMTTEQPLVSMTRYALAIFPMFMLWGAWGKHAWVNRVVVYLSFPLNLYLTAQFVMWGWVG